MNIGAYQFKNRWNAVFCFCQLKVSLKVLCPVDFSAEIGFKGKLWKSSFACDLNYSHYCKMCSQTERQNIVFDSNHLFRKRKTRNSFFVSPKFCRESNRESELLEHNSDLVRSQKIDSCSRISAFPQPIDRFLRAILPALRTANFRVFPE